MPTPGSPVNEIIELVANDKQPSFELTWEGSGDVSGYDLKMHIRYCDDLSTLTKDAVVVDDGSTGNDAIFRWDWQAGELRIGRHEAEIEIFDAGGDNQTMPLFLLDVRRQIA